MYEKAPVVEDKDIQMSEKGLVASPSNNSLSSLEGNRAEGRDITWSGVSFKAGDKPILEKCWGEVKSGEVCAILGPSGAGKSSLLNVLAGRSAARDNLVIDHDITVGGKTIDPVSFRQNIAYVMQEDSLMATSTPREALRFSAHLRLPNTSEQDINNMVEELLTTLGLQECGDVFIGNAMIKGISGGQKKRTSVGVELITKPSLLFLDEPTSGLDSFNAYKLVELLKATAKMNTAVLCTIHQPSSEVFFLFDKVIFLKAGRVFYAGPVKNLVPRFQKIGLACPANYNPADHVMTLSQTLAVEECDKNNYWMQNFTGDGEFVVATSDDKSSDHKREAIAGAGTQLYYLFERELLNIVRDKGALIGRFGITIFLNLLFALIWLNAGSKDDSDATKFSAHFGGLVMVTISSMFGSAQPVMLMFPFERPMFMREYATGTYYSWTYFMTKTLTDVPLTLLQCLCAYAMVYPIMDLQGNFFYMVLAAWGLGCASASCGMALGCAVTDVKDVTEMAPLLFVPQLLFAGFFIATSEIPLMLRWCQWLCGIKYALNIILYTEFGPDNDNCQGDAANLCASALENNDIDGDMIWFYCLMLAALFLAFRLLAAFILVAKSQKFY